MVARSTLTLVEALSKVTMQMYVASIRILRSRASQNVPGIEDSTYVHAVCANTLYIYPNGDSFEPTEQTSRRTSQSYKN